MARSTRYVPLTIQPDDTCAIPRVRPHKIPRIYPLVASTAPLSDYCHQKHRDDDTPTVQTPSSNDWTMGSRRWQVIRVSRSDRITGDAPHLSEKRLRDDTSAPSLTNDDVQSMHLVMTPSDQQKKQPEDLRQSRRKLARIPPKKFRSCDCISPMTRIPENTEIEFTAKPKQAERQNRLR
ncbi:hypothetical protein GCK32_000258 [Trichostrongylus colubriformis]|uniref:Uncharacterized protein n=1 Tax=Trichostrongylus colubriformis TaxID=6319 RepID=A0AAN8F0K2_TRICO